MTHLLFICLAVFRTIVIPVQFEDLKFSDGIPAVKAMTGQAKTYLDTEFRGTKTFEFTIANPVTVSHGFAYYGANSTDRFDNYAYEAVDEACKSVAKSINFSQFDNDGDGYADHIMIVYPGKSEADGAGENYFWPQQSRLSDRNIFPSYGGCKLDSYAAVCELDSNGNDAGAGNFCHELLHGLNLRDFYDTDGEGSGGLCAKDWATVSIMNEGNHNGDGHTPPGFCSVELNLLGIAGGTELSQGHHILKPVRDGANYFLITPSGGNEYFLLENIPGHGLATFHIDRSDSDAAYSDRYKRNLTASERWTFNQVNCNPSHQCVEFSGSKSFKFWDGRTSPLAITDIAVMEDGSVEFDAVEPVCNFTATEYQDAAMLSWTSGVKNVKQCSVSLQKESGETIVTLDPDGKAAVMMRGLSPKTNYLAEIHIQTNGGDNFTIVKEFATKARMAGTVPFIRLSEDGRNPDGSFSMGTRLPLVIYNAEGLAEVRWSFDGEPVSIAPDGTFTIRSSGALKAELFYENGEKETILKEIRVR